MIIVRLSGGLGNQIAQYALIRKLQSIYPETEVKMDLSFYEHNDVHNGFELENVFKISQKGVQTAGKWDLLKVKYEIPFEAFKKFPDIMIKPVAWLNARSRNIFNNIGMRNEIREEIQGKDGVFNRQDTKILTEMIRNIDDDKDWYIDGYWMDEIFWIDILKNLVEELTFPDFIDEQNLSWENHIKDTRSVGIHVRRGDYIGSGFDILTMDYYREAIRYIEKYVGDVTYFVFTDDPQYVKSSFSFLENKKIVQNNRGKNSWCDMKLMSLCNYNILANSSFSNWAGYFNKNSDKIVVYPSRYSKTSMNTDKNGAGWIKLEVR